MDNLLFSKKLFVGLVMGMLIFPALKSSAFFGAKFEPPDGKIYHGAQAEVRPVGIFSRHVDWDGIEQYTEACRRRPKLIMHYISFDPLAFGLLKSTISEISEQTYDYVPQIGLDFYTYFPRFNILKPGDITKKIAEGKYDDKIKDLAQLFIEMKTPVFLRPGYEFGGNGQGRNASKQYWVKAWKRIFSIFQSEGAENVAFVWNTLDEEDFLSYYPGDEYVDWWAINIFRNNAGDIPLINHFVQEAAKHRKPILIAESTPRYVGSVQGDVSWEKWYGPYFRLLSSYPHIKAFCYINASWEKYPDKTFRFDARIQSNTFITSKYKQMLSKPRFINADKK